MGNERVIFSNRFDRPTLEQIEEEMKNKKAIIQPAIP